ncbi:hypothetical protein [Burkholderia multivorans]|uniref:hypothetical protein n=1 Tax=Burkholderia multivorans TaxID=87883 RepID=UPI001C240B27|nr:hypothetical protein [Burkholderia multivorans]MBU9452944.1 hypothetical protein [Burkholderia multivorans]
MSEIAAELHVDGRIRLCIQRVPGCRQRGPARQVLGMTGSVMAVASVVRGAHEPAAGIRRNRPVADRQRRLGALGFLMISAYGRK